MVDDEGLKIITSLKMQL